MGFTGDWRVCDEDMALFNEDLIPILRKKEPQLLLHRYIAWWGMDAPEKKMDKRYQNCDITVPCIVAKDVQNKYDKIFVMIDGGHRMAKMTLETDIRESWFYVISKEEFFAHLKPHPDRIKPQRYNVCM